MVTIGYPVRADNHGALVAALEAWDVRARMGQTDHQARMKEIIDAGSTLTPVDRDYLVDRLKTVDGAREFAKATAGGDPSRQVEWLRWPRTSLSSRRSLPARMERMRPRSWATGSTRPSSRPPNSRGRRCRRCSAWARRSQVATSAVRAGPFTN